MRKRIRLDNIATKSSSNPASMSTLDKDGEPIKIPMNRSTESFPDPTIEHEDSTESELAAASYHEDDCSMEITHTNDMLTNDPLYYELPELSNLLRPLVIDTHCHIDFLFRRLESQPATLDELFALLESDGRIPQYLAGFINVYCDPRTWLRKGFEEMLERECRVRSIYGCHPHFADFFSQETLLLLGELLERKHVVGLGEIGLDYSGKNSCNRETQKNVFKAQLKLGIRKKLPICLHIRNATEDGFKALEEANVPQNYPLHVHCFTGGWSECQRWLSLYPNCKLGITPVVTYIDAAHVHDVVKRIPLDRLLLETDAPYFVPSKLKMSWNFSQPCHAIHTAAQIAALRQESLDTILINTRRNAEELYKVKF